MRTLIGLLAALLNAAAAHATDQGEAMKDISSPQTFCLGRFLVDVPKDVIIVGKSSEYRSRSVSVEKKSQDAFQKMLSDKESHLMSTRHENEPSLLRQLVKAGDGQSATFVFRESPIDAYQYKVQAYKWLNGRLFTLDSRVDDDRAPKALELSAKTLSELQYRRDDEIPAAPGFCVDGGFFAGEPGSPHYEYAFLNVQIKNHPDVKVHIYTDMNGEKVDEGLLARIERKEKVLVIPSELRELRKQIKKLRHGQHPVGNIQAEENLEALPTGDTFFTHQFRWEAPGKPRDIYAPGIVVEMKTGLGLSGGIVRPSVTDKQAIELFDSIVNSIRLRPIGGQGAADKPSPPPRPQAKTPLGTRLMSGSICPQAGEWVCEQQEAVGAPRRAFAEGETLPEVLVPARLSIWQKLRGEPVHRPAATIWTLTALSGDNT